jgi:hypothetical protein
MHAPRSFTFLAIMVPICLAACASTTVKKNPGPHDHGIRYYRPKPYLLVQPPAAGSDEFVTLTLDYLPDFSEEYSIHIRTGIGKNKTSVTLDKGWNLTKLDVDIDSEIPQNIEAFAKLLSAVAPKGLIPTEGSVPKAKVKATNVPIGYYESVISQGPDGKKRLYGWRYVGFAPFAQCPMESGGLEVACCKDQLLYGLVYESGAMTFKPLNQAMFANHGRTQVTGATSSDTAAQKAQSLVVAEVKKYIETFDISMVSEPAIEDVKLDFVIKFDMGQVDKLVKLVKTKNPMVDSPDSLKKFLSDNVTAALQKMPNLKTYTVTINFPQ